MHLFHFSSTRPRFPTKSALTHMRFFCSHPPAFAKSSEIHHPPLHYLAISSKQTPFLRHCTSLIRLPSQNRPKSAIRLCIISRSPPSGRLSCVIVRLSAARLRNVCPKPADRLCIVPQSPPSGRLSCVIVRLPAARLRNACPKPAIRLCILPYPPPIGRLSCVIVRLSAARLRMLSRDACWSVSRFFPSRSHSLHELPFLPSLIAPFSKSNIRAAFIFFRDQPALPLIKRAQPLNMVILHS